MGDRRRTFNARTSQSTVLHPSTYWLHISSQETGKGSGADPVVLCRFCSTELRCRRWSGMWAHAWPSTSTSTLSDTPSGRRDTKSAGRRVICDLGLFTRGFTTAITSGTKSEAVWLQDALRKTMRTAQRDVQYVNRCLQ